MERAQQQTTSHRWTRPQPRVPATRRGVEPLRPAYIPARAKPAPRQGS